MSWDSEAPNVEGLKFEQDPNVGRDDVGSNFEWDPNLDPNVAPNIDVSGPKYGPKQFGLNLIQNNLGPRLGPFWVRT